MKIAYHQFGTERSKGGALYFYTEISKLLRTLSSPGVTSEPHDFHELVRRDPGELAGMLRKLGKNDVVVSNVGPYAHLYLYLREITGAEFRVVRDARTSSWSGFLLQEALCGPLVRPGDLLLLPSEFCRSYFMRLFPGHVHPENSAVCYPLATSFPDRLPQKPHRSGYHVGYIGRMTQDKNFEQVLETFARIKAARKMQCYLHLAGPLDRFTRYGSLAHIGKALKRLGVSPEAVVYAGHLPYAKIWDFFGQIDLFVFPALASVESLGRVLLEAQHAGVPTVAADYAAAAEILPIENLVQPVFRTGQRFRGNSAFSFGTIDVYSAAEAALRARSGEPAVRRAAYRPETYTSHVLEQRRPQAPAVLSERTRYFIDALRVDGARLSYGRDEALALCHRQLAFFRRYNSSSGLVRLGNLIAALPRLLHSPESPALRYDRLINPAAKFELRHMREFCRSAGFLPYFRLVDAL